MAKEMLINVVEGEECRIAIVDKGNLEEFYIERPSSEGHAGNIFKGRVVNIEPSIQAAFIDFGRPKNGFLHVSDIVPIYYPSRKRTKDDKSTEAEKKPSRRSRSGDGDRRSRRRNTHTRTPDDARSPGISGGK